MEAFSLLNYWKTSDGGVSSGLNFLPQSSDSTCRYTVEPTTIVTSVSVTETEDEADGDDEGPFFDLEFAVPVDEEEEQEEEEEEEEEDKHGEVSDDDSKGDERRGAGEGADCTDDGCEFKFTLSSGSGGEDRVNPDLNLSPSDDIYFKGQIAEVEPPPTGTEQTCSVKAPAAQLSASILKSATKLRVFMLGMKKSKLIQEKSKKSEANLRFGDFDKRNLPLPQPPQPQSQSPDSQQKSRVTVNLKVEEVPIVSLFTRDNSSRDSSSSSASSSSSKKQNGNVSVSDENRFVVQKYLKKVKPLYIRVSRRYGEKLKHTGQLTFGSSAPSTRSSAEKTESPATKTHKPGTININIPSGLKVVRKHLGKSRSSSSTTTPPSSTAATITTPSESRRRDDSLLQQQDSIQSAILHCKRCFNSSRDKDPSLLPRSVSDPSSYDK